MQRWQRQPEREFWRMLRSILQFTSDQKGRSSRNRIYAWIAKKCREGEPK